jgi:transcriptional regulator with XRE-family HTH domain
MSIPYDDMVRTARRSADLSQRQLARLAEVAPSSVARVESGRVQPTLRMLVKLLAAAGCELVVVRRSDGRRPAHVRDGTLRDGQGRRYPAHLDIHVPMAYRDGIWPRAGWAPVRYLRNRKRRDVARWAGHVDLRVVPSPEALYGHGPPRAGLRVV